MSRHDISNKNKMYILNTDWFSVFLLVIYYFSAGKIRRRLVKSKWNRDVLVFLNNSSENSETQSANGFIG